MYRFKTSDTKYYSYKKVSGAGERERKIKKNLKIKNEK